MEKKDTLNWGPRFERRHILKAMATAPAAALLSVTPFVSAVAKAAPEQEAGQKAPAAFQPKVLNLHEWKTVRILCDLIIPADQRSCSATQAGVPEFIDDWLAFKGGDTLAELRGGLTWLDMETNRAFKYDFAECARSQQTQILDRIAYPPKAAPEDVIGVEFFNLFRDLVLSGFFTSQAGIKDLPYLGNEPLSEWKGCPEPALAKLGLDKDDLEA